MNVSYVRTVLVYAGNKLVYTPCKMYNDNSAATGGDRAVRFVRRVGPRGLDAAHQDVEGPQAHFQVHPAHAEKGG